MVSLFAVSPFEFLNKICFVLIRTISALWKNRKLSPEQQLELVANVQRKHPEIERLGDDTDSFTGMEEAHLYHVCSFDIPLTVCITFPKSNSVEVP